MKHKTIAADKVTLLLVETENIDKNEDGYWLPNNEGGYMHIPFDQYQLLGRLPDITDEQAEDIVDSEDFKHYSGRYFHMFVDYNNCENAFDDALDSLHSLLQVNEVYFENPLGDKPDINKTKFKMFGSLYKEYSRLLTEWQEAQSKVFDKDRIYLFKKI